jgi:hypothetical protein
MFTVSLLYDVYINTDAVIEESNVHWAWNFIIYNCCIWEESSNVESYVNTYECFASSI